MLTMTVIIKEMHDSHIDSYYIAIKLYSNIHGLNFFTNYL